MKIGYIRVSTVSQNIDRQLDHIELDKVFCDKVSGKAMNNRPELLSCLEFCREGDELYVHSFDRLARSLRDLMNIINTLTAKKVTVRFVKEDISFSGEADNPTNILMLGVMGAIVEYERSLIVQRVREGVAIAKAKGHYKHVGRKSALNADTITEIKERHKNGTRPTDLAKIYGVSRATIYNYLAAND